MYESKLLARISELEAQNFALAAENKRLREALGLPLENISLEKPITEPVDFSEKEENDETPIIGSSINKK